jgi:hypothetical protein
MPIHRIEGICSSLAVCSSRRRCIHCPTFSRGKNPWNHFTPWPINVHLANRHLTQYIFDSRSFVLELFGPACCFALAKVILV